MPTVNGIRRICMKANDGPGRISVSTDNFRISTPTEVDYMEDRGRVYGSRHRTGPPEIEFCVRRWGGSEALADFFRVNPMNNGFRICVEGFQGVKEFIIQSVEASHNEVGFPVISIVGNIYSAR